MPGLEDLYREIIIDHYRTPRNSGELEPPATRTEGFNPLCGDEVIVYALIADGVVEDIKITVQGCSISQASASMMTTAVKGKTLEEIETFTSAFKAMMSIHEHDLEDDGAAVLEVDPALAEVKMGDLEALRGVVKFPVRIKCATLGWNTLAEAITNATAE